ncbi:EscF/YscF/HrpA family type III secretion system needle major subunit [Aquabacterium sp. A7-Y]|uniref:EscF/YscF/HrpA family type III secretion system needle major subunit n=1 Tax=Aquabacterium sp. A7-Y TaxID=1349605 RepID=UPI00223CC24B|nr:EscF/YscF/HrpA family type III secretion system needle major subunit [Aquabacterium sp. A7-Y]MCW7542117.1 EscF/YscF/HrpA family type III secretion system needle major subunit [Aquabacterium sp. A7-Y]
MSVDSLISRVGTAYTQANGVVEGANADDPVSMLKAQKAMSEYQVFMTAASEVVKALGEGAKGTAKNMSV